MAVSSERRQERRRRLWLFVKNYWHRLVGAAVGWFAWDFYYCEPNSDSICLALCTACMSWTAEQKSALSHRAQPNLAHALLLSTVAVRHWWALTPSCEARHDNAAGVDKELLNADGNKLFQSEFINVIHPGSNLLGLLEYNLLNSSVALFGYYFAAFTIDRIWMGRRRMQVGASAGAD